MIVVRLSVGKFTAIFATLFRRDGQSMDDVAIFETCISNDDLKSFSMKLTTLYQQIKSSESPHNKLSSFSDLRVGPSSFFM